MQAIRQVSKGRIGLRFWKRTLGIRAKRKTPHARQALTGVTLWGLVVGMALVLMGQVAFAHTGTVEIPTCGDLPSADAFFTASSTRAANDTELTFTNADLVELAGETGIPLALEEGDTDETGQGLSGFHYGKIILPTLTAGTLTISGEPGGTDRPANAVLCRGTTAVTKSVAMYENDHVAVDTAANTAKAAQSDASRAALLANNSDTAVQQSLSVLRADLLAAKNALTAAVNALIAADDTADKTRADEEKMAIDDVLEDGVEDGERGAANTALTNAAAELGGIVTALEAAGDAEHAEVNLATNLTSGEHSYVVVVAVEESATTIAALTVNFSGIMTTGTESDQGTLSQTMRSATYTLQANTNGLFNARTTGMALKTRGHIEPSPATPEDSTDDILGNEDNDNVNILTPLAGDAASPTSHTLTIRERTDADRGAFGLMLTFYPAERLNPDTAATDDSYADSTRPGEELMAGQSDYFFFTVAPNTYRFLTVKTEKHDDATPATDTSGTLYSMDGRIAMDMDGAADGRNFMFEAPIKKGNYIIEVAGMAGQYVLKTTSVNTAASGTIMFDAMKPVRRPTSGSAPARNTTRATSALHLVDGSDDNFYTIIIPEKVAGTLYLQASIDDANTNPNAADTVGVLFERSGKQAVKSDKGAGMHFQIAHPVMTGSYTLQVYGKAFGTMGDYVLTILLVEDSLLTALDLPAAPPPTDSGALAMACQDDAACAARLREDYVMAGTVPDGYVPTDHEHPDILTATNLAFEPACRAANFVRTVTRTITVGGGGGGRTPPSASSCRSFSNAAVEDYKDSLIVETDATGSLENPAHGSIGSGISVISGWVCAANEVEVRLRDAATGTVTRHQVAYGTSRRDTRDDCNGASGTGFGMTFNFNLLPEGDYTIAAYADGERIGGLNTFEVVHLSDSEYLEDVDGMCHVAEFPEDGYTTQLGWQESLQNFVIENVSMDEEPAPEAAE